MNNKYSLLIVTLLLSTLVVGLSIGSTETLTGLNTISFDKEIQKSSELSNNQDVATVHAATKKYVGSKKSNVYHKLKCRSAKRIKSYNKRYFSSVKKAKKAGYRACKVCM